jgi:hypothetical protein
MDRGRVGEDRGSKETDGCPLTVKVFQFLLELVGLECYEFGRHSRLRWHHVGSFGEVKL